MTTRREDQASAETRRRLLVPSPQEQNEQERLEKRLAAVEEDVARLKDILSKYEGDQR